MAITRIKTDNISNDAVTSDKIATGAVTAGKLENNLTYGSDLTVSGDLTVMGLTTTVESTTVTVADPLLVLAAGQTGAGAVDAGILIERGTDTNAAFIWSEATNQFVAIMTTDDGTASGSVASTGYADLTVNAIIADSDMTAGNLNFSGNEITSTDGNGNITFSPDGTGAVVVNQLNDFRLPGLDTTGIAFIGSSGTVSTATDLAWDNGTSTLTALNAELGDLTFSTDTISSTGNINLSANGGAGIIDVDGGTVTNLATPQNSTDAATKDYVDNAVSAGGATISQDDSSVVVTDDGSNPGSVAIEVDGTSALTATSSSVTFAVDVIVDDLTVAGQTISTTTANKNIILDPHGTGVIEMDGPLQVNNLTAGRVPYVGVGGVITNESGFEYDATSDTLSVPTVVASTGVQISAFSAGKVVITTTNGALTTDTDLTYDTTTDTLTVPNLVATTSFEISGLTNGRVLIAGLDGAITDDGGLIYSGGEVTAGDLVLSTGVGSGALTAVSGTFSGLTSTRIPFITTGGLLTDDADFTYTVGSDTLTVTNITSTGTAALGTVKSDDLTPGRVVFSTTDGQLTDEAGFEYDATTDTLTVGTISVTDLTIGTLDVNTSATLATAYVEDLTATRVVFVGAGGQLVDDSTLHYSSGLLSATSISTTGTVEAHGLVDADMTTAGRVVLTSSTGQLVSGSGLTFDSGTGSLTATTFVGDLTGQVSDISNHDTDDLAEGTTNKYFSNTLARGAISVTGDLGYDNATGVISYTLPNTDSMTEGTTNKFYSDALVDAHLSGGTGVTYTGGSIAIGQAVGTTDNVTFATVTADLTGDVSGDLTGQVLTASQTNITSLGTLTGLQMNGAIDMDTNHITNLATPTLDYHASTKKYVDDAVANITTFDITDGTNNDALTIGTDSLTFSGTANEVTATVSANTVTFGLASDVTIANDLTVTADLFANTADITTDATIGGTLDVTGDFAVNSTAFTVNATTGNATVGNDLTIQGNFYVNGSTVTVGSESLTVHDNLIHLNEVSDATITNAVGNGTTVTFTANNTFAAGEFVTVTGVSPVAYNISGLIATATTSQFTVTNSATGSYSSGGTAHADTRANVDLGVVGSYYDSADLHAGVFRDATDGKWKFFDSLTTTPGVDVPTSDASFAFADVQGNMFWGDLTGDVTGTVSSLSNHTTDNLTEGSTNLYFTTANARGAISGGTGVSYDNVTGVISIGQAVGTTDNVTFNEVTADVVGTVSSLSNHDTDDLAEGTTNKYYADSLVDNHLSGGTGVSYSLGQISIGQAVGTTDNVTFNTVTADLTGDVTGTVSSLSNHDTDDLAEGLTNLYYTDTKARGALSVTDAGGDGSLTYSAVTGEFTYTGPSATEVRAHFSGGTGVDITNGVISIGQAVGTTSSVTFNDVEAGTLTSTGTVAGYVFYAGTGGVLDGAATFTYNEGTDTLAAGNIEATNLTAFGILDSYLVYSNSGALTGSNDFTIDSATGTLSVTNLDVTSTASFSAIEASTVTATGLTSGRLVFASTGGLLSDDNTLLFDSATDTLEASNVDVTGTLSAGTIQGNALTSGRVIFATANGQLTDDSTFTFDAGSDSLGVTNLDVATQATLASAIIEDLSSGRVVLVGASGTIVDSASLLFDTGTGALTVNGSVAVDNITINGNTISSTDTNGNITFLPNGTGTVDVSSVKITNLATPTSDYDASTKKYVDDTFGLGVSLISQNNTSVEVVDNNLSAGHVDVTIDATLTAKFTDAALEVYNSLEVDNITIDGNEISTTDLNGDLTLSPNGSGSVVVDAGKNFKISDLSTAGQVLYTGADGLVTAEAGFEYNASTDTLSVANNTIASTLTLSDFTTNSVLFVGASGVVSEDSDLTWDSSDFAITGGLVVTGTADVDNVNIDGNTISTTDTNGNLVLQPNGTGSTVVNDAGNSSDFVVKSVNQAGMFFVDASADVIGIKTITPNAEAALHIESTDSIILPVGAQGDRPGTPVTGMFRFNTTSSKLEVYDSTAWVSIGENQTTTVVSETFSGDGTEVNFTLSQTLTTAAAIVSINGVVQIPGTAYSISGSTLTFTEAPELGDTVEVRQVVTTTQNQTVIGSDDGASLFTYDQAGDQFPLTVANNTVVMFTDKGLDLRSGSAIICGDANTSVGTTATVVDTFAKATYRVAKYVCQVANSGLGEFQACELLVVHDGTTAKVTEFAEVYTGSASLGSFSAVVNGSNIEVKFTGANAGNAVKVMPTYIKA
jgi:hypothetical protein